MPWIERQLTGGVVTTRSETTLRDGELRSSEFCRLQPGDTSQVWPDWAYAQVGSEVSADDVLLQKVVTFDALEDARLLQVFIQPNGSTVLKLSKLDGTGEVSLVAPGTATTATMVSRGAEYFVGTDVGNWIIDENLSWRELGLKKAGYDLVVTRDEDFLFGSDNYEDERREWSSTLSTVNYALLLEALYDHFDDSELLEEAVDRVRGSVWNTAPDPFLTDYMPVKRIEVTAPGAAFVGGYWLTNYYSDKAVESGPSTLSDAYIIDTDALVLEIEMDVQDVLRNWDVIKGIVSDQREQLMTDQFRDELRAWIADNGGSIKVQLEVPKGLKETLGKVSVSWTDASAEAVVDKVRLYRGIFRQLPDWRLIWNVSNGFAVFSNVAVVRGLEEFVTADFLQEVADGLVVLNGGLLKQLDVDETSYVDDLRGSGVANPSTAYPTVNYFDRGSLGIYEYLKRPDPFVVAANVGKSLVFVTEENRQVIRMTPSGDPENAPPIYAIPVTSKNQDKIVAMETIKDFAVVFTTTSTLRLNYLPFETSQSQDSVLSQISDNHGAISQELVTTVETDSGQVCVWLSRTGLMGTDGFGFRDMCPDFSVTGTGLSLDEAEDWTLTNNVKDYRLELWVGGARWDFYYHPTQMKDVRGDGLGLSFKLMGPSSYWSDRSVLVSDGAVVDDEPVVVIGYLKDGKLFIAQSSSEYVKRDSSMITGVLWGSNPLTALQTEGIGLKYKQATDYPTLRPQVLSYGIDGTEIKVWNENLSVNQSKGFSYLVPAEALGEGVYFAPEFRGGPVGPMWIKVREVSSGFGG